LTEDMTKVLLDQFEVITESPGGVKRLRELLLQLAVTGRLGTGDEKDEPVSFLLKKIKAEIRRSLNSVGIKAVESNNNNNQHHRSLAIPLNWLNVKLGEIILSNLGGGTPSKNNSSYWDGTINWASVKDLKDYLFLSTTEDKITKEGLENSSSNLIPAGNVIICTRMGLGKISINTIDVAINQDLRGISLPNGINPLFFVYFYKTLTLVGKGLTVKGISVKELHNIDFPLPPLAEQHRIVEKVDRLMALCDELEARQSKKHGHLVRLGKWSLMALQQSETPEELARWWGHLQAHFGLVFDCVENVEALRQTILQLAVTGRLGTGDEGDLDATNFCYKIANSNERFEHILPKKWVVTNFLEIIEIKSNLVDPINYLDYPHIAPNNIEKSTGKLLYYQTVREDGISSPNHLFHKGQLLYSKIRPNLSKLVIAEFDGLCSADMYPIESKIDLFYLKIFMLSLPFLSQVISDDNRIAMPKINKTQLYSTIISIPPLAEQHRIVEKVDLLMTLCDELEKKIEYRSKNMVSLSTATIQQIMGMT